MENRQTIDISITTIFRIIAIILGVYFLYLIRDILLMLFVALIIAAAVDGPVDWLARHKVKRVFGTAIVYCLVFSALALTAYMILPPLASQLAALANSLPEIMEKLGTSLSFVENKIGVANIQKVLANISGQLSGAASDILGTAVGIFGGIFNAVVVLFISIYLVAQNKSLKNLLAAIMPERHQAYAANLAERIHVKLGAWLRGQLILMFIVGLLFYIGLLLLGVKYALTLALLAALFEIIPFIGPFLAGAVATGMALLQSPFLALLALILFIVIQQLEGNVIGPQVMKRVVGMNPIIVIVSLVIGGQLAGLLGIVVAVPIAAVVSLIATDYFGSRSIA